MPPSKRLLNTIQENLFHRFTPKAKTNHVLIGVISVMKIVMIIVNFAQNLIHTFEKSKLFSVDLPLLYFLLGLVSWQGLHA